MRSTVDDTVDVTASWMRGGTSKCWLFAADAVTASGVDRDALLESALGSGDRRQIDGVGGATPTTSKIAIVSSSSSPVVDVEYLFGQVGIASRGIEWGSNCGNCATAIGLYAVQEGIVKPSSDRTTVRLHNLNTGARLDATIATLHGQVPWAGNTVVPGVTNGGVAVDLTFRGPFPRMNAYPTGRCRETVTAAGISVDATVVDAGAPALLLDAAGVGMTAVESAQEVDGLLPMLTAFRAVGAVLHGIIQSGAPAPSAIPKTGVVGPPRDYRTADGTLVHSNDYDIAVRMLSMGAAHPAIGLTSAVAVAVAAATPGSLPSAYITPGTSTLRIGTISGVVTVEVAMSASGTVESVTLHRAARRLADATLHIPVSPRVETAEPLAPTLTPPVQAEPADRASSR